MSSSPEPSASISVKAACASVRRWPYSESARIGECYRQWVEQLAGVSGIEMAGATSQLPLDGNALDLGS